MGIQIISRPLAALGETPGPLNLPPDFDRKKYAAKWVKEGPAVAAAAERQWIPGTQATADGWEVWRNAENKPHKVALQVGTHVLLCRPRAVQDAVNAICGNVGKSRLSQERKGETVAGKPPEDPGMLNDDRIAKVAGKEELEEGDIQMNPVPDTEHPQRVETPALKTAGTKRVTSSRFARRQAD